jgi:hypothetical protein
MKKAHYKKVAKKKKSKSRKILTRRATPKKRIVKRKRRKFKPAITDTPTPPGPLFPYWTGEEPDPPPLPATEIEKRAGQDAVEHAPPTPIPPDVAESANIPTTPDDHKDT